MSARGTTTPRAAIGRGLMRQILTGGTRRAELKDDRARDRGTAHTYAEGDDVWLWMHAPTGLKNPLSGEDGVWAAATVIGAENGLPVVATTHMRLVGPVWPAQLKPRKPGEIAPGRKSFGPGHAVAR